MTAPRLGPDGAPPVLDTVVHGVDLDSESRCAHYHSPLDIVAIKFKCCATFYACRDCHAALADHPALVWPAEQWNERAIRCGACGSLETIVEYVNGPPMCPACGASFNPGCRNHHQFYFDTPVADR